jgi:ABC-type transporter Mla MlaB component
VLRDILAELQKMNKPVEIDDIPDRIKALQMLYDDNKEGKTT